MPLIISNGCKTHIEKSITPGAGGLAAFRTNIRNIATEYPFEDSKINTAVSTGKVTCWGFRRNKFTKLYNNIAPNDHLLLFENMWENGREILNPRIFYGKVTHKAINPAFAEALWGKGWHYVYFLTQVDEMTGYSKENILFDSGCLTGTNWFRFKQKRFL